MAPCTEFLTVPKIVALRRIRPRCRSCRLHGDIDCDGKLNGIDPQAWLADVLARIADTPITKLEQLLRWNWAPPTVDAQAA